MSEELDKKLDDVRVLIDEAKAIAKKNNEYFYSPTPEGTYYPNIDMIVKDHYGYESAEKMEAEEGWIPSFWNTEDDGGIWASSSDFC